jgi:hypothetical protein
MTEMRHVDIGRCKKGYAINDLHGKVLFPIAQSVSKTEERKLTSKRKQGETEICAFNL